MPTNKTSKPAVKGNKPAVTVAPVPAPKAAAPATTTPAPAPAPAPAAWQGFKHPVTQAQLTNFIATQCGGNPALCGIVPLPNAVQGAKVPFLKQAASQRATIINALLWGYVQGHTGPVNLQGAYTYFAANKLATQGYLDVLALLNGGFSAAAKATWGTPFVKLVALPAPTAGTPAA